MPHKLVTFLVFMWFMGKLWDSMVSGSFIGADTSNVFNDLGFIKQVDQVGQGGAFQLIKAPIGYFTALMGILVVDLNFLQGPLSFIRYLFMIISVGFIAVLLSLFLTAVLGVFTAVRGIFS